MYLVHCKLLGVVASDIFIDTIVDTVLNVQLKTTGFAYLLDEKGNTLIHKEKELLEKENSIFKQVKNDEKSGFGEAQYEGKELLVAYNQIPITGWYLQVQLDKKEIFDEINSNIIKEVILYYCTISYYFSNFILYNGKTSFSIKRG
ncbi:cache domain-containing protein [Malaciobacter mytili]|uniref:cache domain-containing protein n=1 Tax=Malaciobacter mytili TaxID=603050 RepID=UPI003A87D49B